MPRPYAILDVFTATPFEGNGLAIVEDADGLDGGAMQKIAREFNLAETVFILPPDNPVHSARVRIFTPAEELPFAGHPTIGTALFLARRRGTETTDALITLEEGIGPIRCGATLHGKGGHAWFDARVPMEEATSVAVEDLASALGVDRSDIGFENHLPSVYSSGVPYLFVPMRNLASIAKAAPQTGRWAEVFGDLPAYLYTRETMVVARQFHARMFAPAFGIAEDPATGSAAAAFAGVAHRFDAHPPGNHTLIIEQGFEMGRPSLMSVEMDVEADGVGAVRVGGEAVFVARGELDV